MFHDFSPLVDVSLETGSASNMVAYSWYCLVISSERKNEDDEEQKETLGNHINLFPLNIQVAATSTTIVIVIVYLGIIKPHN